ncbi:MAG: 4Fe-4S dicluster domain-containing protein [Myxococcales bacterium]|nr:4Fe-4S dicluster domain-containing protein [Myxococcales bacterium]MBK7197918.1 4Fe-4S dicluster domain-containing protein [Myxococcales bacterium]MBP6844973.1 4Fe-4S dicluster domain-containing protein [Kofleriaceae bacterium]
MSAAAAPSVAPAAPEIDPLSALRAVPALAGVPDAILAPLVASGAIAVLTLPRDTVVTTDSRYPMCVVASGQVSLALFDRSALTARLAHRQRDAAKGERDGTLLPPPPLAHVALRNLALFTDGDAWNPTALAADGDDAIAAFALTGATVVALAQAALTRLRAVAAAAHDALGAALAHTGARLQALTGVRQELLDFYLRNGLSLAGPSVRVRQLDRCIDCKQCEDACEERHGARRLTLGGFELGLVDVVFTCRTCTDARCLSPCEHDAIKRDPASGEVKIDEARCIGCSLCALSCPYGAIDMVNVAEPDMPSWKPAFKARLEKDGRLAFGPGKGRVAPARRIANKCDHCAGYADQACVAACPTGSLVEVAPAALFVERPPSPPPPSRKKLVVLPTAPFTEGLGVTDAGLARIRARRLSWLPWFLGLGAFVAVLAEVVLRRYAPTSSVSYRLLRLDGLEPEIAAMNVSYLAGSKLALTCGYVGTALMVLSMAYVLQRRTGWFHRTASNQFWLDVHLMTGIVGPLFIVLHSALRLTTWVSVPFWSMTAVVLSGVLGRYLYTLVPSLTVSHDLAILEQRRLISEVAAEHPAAAAKAQLEMEREATHAERSWQIGLTLLLGWVLLDDLRRYLARGRLRRALRGTAPRKIVRRLVRAVDRVVFYERRKVLAPRSKALLKAWKRVHIPFSMVLLVTMLAHIAIALRVV